MEGINSRRFSPRQGRDWPITDLPALSDADCQQLADLGIHTTIDLLRHSQNLERQTRLAQRLQLHLHHVQKWRALADLARVPSVGRQYCGLLLHAGVPSVQHLANLLPGRLHRQILKLQVNALQRVDLCPNAAIVEQWIRQAKVIEPIV
jgi:hypothetical protein